MGHTPSSTGHIRIGGRSLRFPISTEVRITITWDTLQKPASTESFFGVSFSTYSTGLEPRLIFDCRTNSGEISCWDVLEARAHILFTHFLTTSSNGIKLRYHFGLPSQSL